MTFIGNIAQKAFSTTTSRINGSLRGKGSKTTTWLKEHKFGLGIAVSAVSTVVAFAVCGLNEMHRGSIPGLAQLGRLSKYTGKVFPVNRQATWAIRGLTVVAAVALVILLGTKAILHCKKVAAENAENNKKAEPAETEAAQQELNNSLDTFLEDVKKSYDAEMETLDQVEAAVTALLDVKNTNAEANLTVVKAIKDHLLAKKTGLETKANEHVATFNAKADDGNVTQGMLKKLKSGSGFASIDFGLDTSKGLKNLKVGDKVVDQKTIQELLECAKPVDPTKIPEKIAEIDALLAKTKAELEDNCQARFREIDEHLVRRCKELDTAEKRAKSGFSKQDFRRTANRAKVDLGEWKESSLEVLDDEVESSKKEIRNAQFQQELEARSAELKEFIDSIGKDFPNSWAAICRDNNYFWADKLPPPEPWDDDEPSVEEH